MGTENMSYAKITTLEVFCTPKDLRDIADHMEKYIQNYKKNPSAYPLEEFGEYIDKTKGSLHFCINIDKVE
jgi:SET domain-containing protein